MARYIAQPPRRCEQACTTWRLQRRCVPPWGNAPDAALADCFADRLEADARASADEPVPGLCRLAQPVRHRCLVASGGYIGGAVLAGVLVWRLEAAWPPRLAGSAWFGTMSTLRSDLIGVLVMAGIQFFSWFTQGQFDLQPLFTPAIFIIAEGTYETIAGLINRSRPRRWERHVVASSRVNSPAEPVVGGQQRDFE